MQKVRRNAVDLSARRQRVVDTAARLFQDRGLQNVSMSDIAHASDLAKPVLYRVFVSRKELESAIFQPVIDLVKNTRSADYYGAGSHAFAIYQSLLDCRPAALLVLRDCRVSSAHAHWFNLLDKHVADRLLLLYRPTEDAPEGAEDRSHKAARWMSSLYVETLTGWLEEKDGLSDERRRAWFSQVVQAWWSASRREFNLGTAESPF